MALKTDDASPPKLMDDIFINRPASLVHLCISFISDHHKILFWDDEDDFNPNGLKFRNDIFIPAMMTDDIFNYFLLHSSISPERLLSAFTDPSKCCLQKLHLSNVTIDFNLIYNLCAHQNIKHFELFNVTFAESSSNLAYLPQLCQQKMSFFHLFNVRRHSNDDVIQFQRLIKPLHSSLKSLKMSGCVYAWYFTNDEINPPPLLSLELSGITTLEEPFALAHATQVAMNKNGDDNLPGEFVSNGFSNATDELEATFRANQDSLEAMDELYVKDDKPVSRSLFLRRYRLSSLKDTLISLILYNTVFEWEDVETIFQLKKLQHLDIGASLQHDQQMESVSRPADLTVWMILENLPELISLDVSSTDIGDRLYIDGKAKTITGERSLSQPVPRRLDFLGLCESEGCEVSDIYALASEVAGYHGEHQLITAVQRYRDRPRILTTCYSHLYTLHMHQPLVCPHKILKLLMESLRRHPNDNQLTLTCTANLFYLTRQMHYTTMQKNDIILLIMKCVTTQKASKSIVRNLLLTLFHFDIPADFLFQFGRITKTLLNVLVDHQDHSDINILAINLCNTLVCSAKHDMKLEVSKYSFVKTILQVIRRRLQQNRCDEFMEGAWSTLWNVSDETPVNSEEFIKLNGLQTLRHCFKQFSSYKEVQKNMMGLVGNIAEVKHLRKYLMTDFLINLFCNLLNENGQHIEVAYNVCGTLSHLLSDGPSTWLCNEPSQEQVRRDMFNVIESWDINSHRSINYRSFLPILSLIECDIPECVHWAVWALCNLSNFDRKYYKLLVEEDALKYLNQVAHKQVLDKTKQIAKCIIEHIEAYLRNREEVDSEEPYLPLHLP